MGVRRGAPNRRAAVENLVGPIADVLAAVTATLSAAFADAEEDRASGLVKLFDDLCAGLPAPDDHDRARRERLFVPVFVRMELEDPPREIARDGRNAGALECAGCDYDLVRIDRAVIGVKSEAFSVTGTKGTDLGPIADRGVDE